ncbi:CDP-4-keto-6-deoxy-D-glucose-3-dehydrase [Candidatus Pacearchaeota archaeon]|jgi:CDP-6-deoxy-D-xylo-4-hexulose-3-dehydrase|nr:CDP-4-keto-6-deoxy-D-glucose-3-dehydrase [Candidatus Pacearchaeota archaeon]
MFKWQLINDSITQEDKQQLIDYISVDNVRFTQGSKVKEFENAWSEWLDVKHSVFVNSGASANYIMVSILKELKGTGEVIVPTLGWVSDVSPIVNLGLKPVFVDVSLETFSTDLEKIKPLVNKNTIGVTLVHCLGFNAITDKLVDYCKENDLFLIEDCCESHGATYNSQKIGTFGDVSNFSFYFGHHMTTIEGGMVCTNDDEIFQYAKMFRSHGMTRLDYLQDDELGMKLQKKYETLYPDLNPLFTFAVPGYNVRNQELNAVLGLSQIKRLDYNIDRRVENLNIWIDSLSKEKFFVDFTIEGNSNFALPLIVLNSDKNRFIRVCDILEDNQVEYRIGTAGGGNQAKQPYLEKYDYYAGDLPNSDYIHEFALYIGNHSELKEEQIKELCKKLNEES